MKTVFIALALLCSGCVTTEFTRGDMTVKRTAFWSDFDVEATANPDGSLSIKETQSNDASAILDLLTR